MLVVRGSGEDDAGGRLGWLPLGAVPSVLRWDFTSINHSPLTVLTHIHLDRGAWIRDQADTSQTLKKQYDYST